MISGSSIKNIRMNDFSDLRGAEILSFNDAGKYSSYNSSPIIFVKNRSDDFLANLIIEDDVRRFIDFSNNCDISTYVIKHNNELFNVYEFCSICGSINIFKYLIKNDVIEESIVKFALRSGNNDVIELCFEIFDAYKYINVAVEYCLNSYVDYILENYDNIPDISLITCCKANNIEGVIYCLVNGYDPNVEEEMLPLLIAAQAGNDYMVELLLYFGADINKRNINGFSAIYYSVYKNHLSTCKLLISKNADIEIRNNWVESSLHCAAQIGNMSIVKVLVEAGADTNAKNRNGYTPLYCAASHGNYDVCVYLIDNGALVHLPSEAGHTALFAAVRNNHLDICEMLVKRGANINFVSKSGTVLHTACFYGRVEIVRFLLDNGADCTLTNANSTTPLLHAALNGNAEICRLLLSHGADPNKKNDTNNTALEYASISKNDSHQACIVLREYGAVC